MKQYYVYIVTNKEHGTLYIGKTNDLIRRVYEHKTKPVEGFTKQYNLNKLVYFEKYDDVRIANQRESNLKHWIRKWKIELINQHNPDWDDLYETICK